MSNNKNPTPSDTENGKNDKPSSSSFACTDSISDILNSDRFKNLVNQGVFELEKQSNLDELAKCEASREYTVGEIQKVEQRIAQGGALVDTQPLEDILTKMKELVREDTDVCRRMRDTIDAHGKPSESQNQESIMLNQKLQGTLDGLNKLLAQETASAEEWKKQQAK